MLHFLYRRGQQQKVQARYIPPKQERVPPSWAADSDPDVAGDDFVICYRCVYLVTVCVPCVKYFWKCFFYNAINRDFDVIVYGCEKYYIVLYLF